MVEKEHIFLTIDQALQAICNDFRQYNPQIMLFCGIIRLISNGDTVVTRDRKKNGAWISTGGHQNMRWMDGPELVDYLCETVTTADLNSERLSAVCARVFQTHAFPDIHPETGQAGIRVETGMEEFHCLQCGRCCRSLDYSKELTAQDVAKWQALGRTDILKWVGVFKGHGHKTAYRIWMIPGTTQPARECPFFQKMPSENRWTCRIHDVKPAICRQYPASRKHAVMTGCPGFERTSRNKWKEW